MVLLRYQHYNTTGANQYYAWRRGQNYFGLMGKDDDSIGLCEQLAKGIRVFGGLNNLEDVTSGQFEPSDDILLANKPAASAPTFCKDWQNDSMILLRPEQHSHVGYNMHIAVGLSNQNTLLHTLQHSLSSDEQAKLCPLVPAQEEQQVYVEATVGRPCQLQSCHLKVLLRSRQDWKSAIRNCAPQ